MASSTPYLVLLLCLTTFLQALLTAANYPPPPPPPFELPESEVRERFSKWVVKYSKHYSCQQEEEMRFQVFKNNTNAIGQFDQQNPGTVVGRGFQPSGFQVGSGGVRMNRFGDLSPREVIQQFTGLNTTSFNATSPTYLPYHSFKPCCVDWRSSGAVTGVKNQGICGKWSSYTSEQI
jgi:hypothetical protein